MNEEYIVKRIEELTKDYTTCINGIEELNRQKLILNNKAITISGQIQELKLLQEKMNEEKAEKAEDSSENK